MTIDVFDGSDWVELYQSPKDIEGNSHTGSQRQLTSLKRREMKLNHASQRCEHVVFR